MKIIFASLLVAVVVSTATHVNAQSPKGLQVNETAPDFSGKDQNNKDITLTNELQRGKVILVFYRGEWCPYCNRYLKELEESFPKFKAKGASIIAVTPELPTYVEKTIEKTKASYSILHDKALTIMKSYDVSYTLDAKAIKAYKGFGLDFQTINGEENNNNLPVPAVYVIDKNKKIIYRYFNADYKDRAPISEILKNL